MSEMSGGPGFWQASDGLLVECYPPWLYWVLCIMHYAMLTFWRQQPLPKGSLSTLPSVTYCFNMLLLAYGLSIFNLNLMHC